MNELVVISKLPKAGLGNKLFSWASGLVFSKINHREHIIIGLTKIHPGAIFRREKSSRFYRGYFKNEKLLFLTRFRKFTELEQKDADSRNFKNQNVVFSQIPHWSDMFHTLKNYRELIIEGFWNDLTKRIKEKIIQHAEPEIGVHIRMGDFRVLRDDEDFSKVGSVRTPLDYFVEVIRILRKEAGCKLSVTVFSDGSDQELEEILKLPNTKRAKDDLDIVHLALLSKSDIVVMSAGSTFSFWAGFLSKAILINHYQHQHAPIRDEATNKLYYEGAVNIEKEKIEVSLKEALNRIVEFKK